MSAARYRVDLSRQAEDDLEAIHAYAALSRGVDEANALLDLLLGKVAMLEQYPLRGSVPNEVRELGHSEYRQILMLPYRLIYEVIEDRVLILVIADGRRDMQGLLEQRLPR